MKRSGLQFGYRKIAEMKQMIAIYNTVDHVFLVVVKGAISSLVCQARLCKEIRFDLKRRNSMASWLNKL